MLNPPQNPAGEEAPEDHLSPARRAELIAEIAALPAQLRDLLANSTQLDTKYRNWTIRQIVHHLADSHLNAYLRFKWALTEETPTIKPYDESKWSALPDAIGGDIVPPLALLEATHARWLQLLGTMSDADFSRSYFHPEKGRTVSLNAALASYAWHGRHHAAQVQWILANGSA